MNPPRVETIVVTDPETGNHAEILVHVLASFTLRGDCGCWPHRKASFDLEVIISPVLVGVRPLGEEHHFRELAIIGPLGFYVEDTKRYER